MNGLILTGALLASCLVVSDATFIIAAPAAVAATTITVGPALASLALLKVAAIKGLVVGSLLSRGKRSTGEEFEALLLSASQRDFSDCAKKLVCEVNGLSLSELRSEEAMIARLFNAGSLDLAKATVEFDLAAQIGKRVGKEQCSIIYERCPHDRQKLMEIFRNPNLVNES